MGSYARFGREEGYYILGEVDPVMTPITVNFQWASGVQIPETMAPIPSPLTAAHQNLASKIFCLCCRDCEDPRAMDDPKAPSEPQDQQPSTCSLQKEGLDSKNSKHANEASHSPLGQPLIHPEKRASTTSNNEYEELNTHVSQRGFCKRNLNRYSRDRWPFQPCHIGRP
ncbi:testis-expressed protein 48 [Puma concolor]|uniref:Testis-expressed protein 48 n=1 Tax=Puma concolor TaxID=9696 RepID=A0A6P6GYH7_PUMCO|nr:testis-expressed protein 48 [Puma concolor]